MGQIRFLVVSIAWLIGACASTDTDQACRPELQTGCLGNEFCTLTRSGVSICVEKTLGLREEGQLCETFETLDEVSQIEGGLCRSSLACVQDGSYARCLKLCDLNADPILSCSDQLPNRHPFADRSECRLRVFGRPEIGLCRLPCKFGASGEAAGCPPSSTCGLAPDGKLAQCLAEGPSQEGQYCGVNCGCEGELVCVTENGRHTCRKALDVGGCQDTAFLVQVHGSTDPLSQSDVESPYQYCSRCVPFAASGNRLWLCMGEGGCELDKTLSTLEATSAADVAQAIKAQLGPEFGVQVGLEFRMGGWFWPSSSSDMPVIQAADDNACPVLKPDGQFGLDSSCPSAFLCSSDEAFQCPVRDE